MPRGIYVRKTFKPLIDRIYAKTKKTDTCWLWIGAKSSFGYGQIYSGGTRSSCARIIHTHRAVWEYLFGAIPAGLCVLHRCDIPSCLNPDHLFLGDKADNTSDMRSKGRMKVGTALPQTKLTEDDIKAIRMDTGSQSEIARRFGISKSHVHAIIHRRCWRHLP
jgi:hypothetical protein